MVADNINITNMTYCGANMDKGDICDEYPWIAQILTEDNRTSLGPDDHQSLAAFIGNKGNYGLFVSQNLYNMEQPEVKD